MSGNQTDLKAFLESGEEQLPGAAKRRKVGEFCGWIALGLILALGVSLRLWVLSCIPVFFGPGDPARYMEMADSLGRGRGFVVDFVWHYLRLPASVTHVEDYYEPVFPLALSYWFQLFGQSVTSAKAMSVAFGSLNILLAYILGKRFAGVLAGVLSASLIALHPQSIYYSALIMKESFVCTLLLATLLCLLSKGGSLSLFAAGAMTGLTGSAQYEMLPVLVPAVILVTMMKGMRNLVPLFLGILCGLAPTVLYNYRATGLPLGYKMDFFLGRSLLCPPQDATVKPFELSRLSPPLGYIGESCARALGPGMAAAMLISVLRNPRRGYSLFLAAFAPLYLYFHGVPRDLWLRDFIVPFTVFAPAVASAVVSSCRKGEVWLFLFPTVVATLYFTHTIATEKISAEMRSAMPPLWLPWALALPWFIAGIIGSFGERLSLQIRRTSATLTTAALFCLCLVSVVAELDYHSPYGDLPSNPIEPGFHWKLIQLRAPAKYIKADTEKQAVIMTDLSGEVHFFTGRKTVRTPQHCPEEEVRRIIGKYQVGYILQEKTTDLVEPPVESKLEADFAHFRLLKVLPSGEPKAKMRNQPPRVPIKAKR